MKKKNGFTVLEFVLLFVIIVAAWLAMQVYLKQALSGKWKEAIDSFSSGRQYPEGQSGERDAD